MNGWSARSDRKNLTDLEQGLMRYFAHCPEQALGLMAFGGALKQNRSLPDRLVELVRLRVAFFNQCRSCMAIRYADAVADGVTEGLVCSLERPQEAANPLGGREGRDPVRRTDGNRSPRH